MAGKNIAVFGIYGNCQAVEYALTRFQDAGFRNTDVSILLPENLGTKDLATEKSTKAPEGAAAGAGSGAIVGGALGWLVGIGAFAIPESDRFSLPVQLFPPWQVSVLEGPSEVLQAL